MDLSALTIEGLLKQMYDRSASDLLLTVGTPPQFRINGILQPGNETAVTPEDTRRLTRGLLNDEQMQRLQEQKSLDFSWGVDGLSRFRLNVYYQRDALALAIRMIPFDIPPFAELGLPEITRDFSMRPHGLVLITGAAGSGKSTTLAAMVDHINHTKRCHVVCIEDPIEYLHHHHQSVVDQREVREDAHSFADALRSVFRQTPDVIMVGEMRDLETTQLALTLAETGHLILATLHTQDATHAVNRIVDMFPAPQQPQIYSQLSLVLVGVIAQQLILSKDGTGRVLAYEVMNVNNAIRNLMREMQVQQIYSVIQTGRNDHMVTMNESLKRLCGEGLIDVSVAYRKSPRPKEFARMLAL